MATKKKKLSAEIEVAMLASLEYAMKHPGGLAQDRL
jgi:hypothetical protein